MLVTIPISIICHIFFLLTQLSFRLKKIKINLLKNINDQNKTFKI